MRRLDCSCAPDVDTKPTEPANLADLLGSPPPFRDSVLHLQIHQLCRRHHVVVQICHDQERSDHDQDDDQHTERQRHHVVGVVRPGGDMQEEHQMDAHLRDRKHRQAERDTAGPEQRCVGDPERQGLETHRESQSDRVDKRAGRCSLFHVGEC